MPRLRLHWPGHGWKRQSVCDVGQSKYNYMCLEFDGKFVVGRKESFSKWRVEPCGVFRLISANAERINTRFSWRGRQSSSSVSEDFHLITLSLSLAGPTLTWGFQC